MVMQSNTLSAGSRIVDAGSSSGGRPTRRPSYVEALKLLLADGVVFAHKLRAADWSVDDERARDLRELFQNLGRAAERMNGALDARAVDTGLTRARPELGDAFGRTRLEATGPARPGLECAEDTLEDIRYLNAGLRVAALLADGAGDGEAARVLLCSADELEGFGWVLAAWLN